MDVSRGVAIVTGGAQGIGKAICVALLKRECKVCCLDVNVEEGKKTVQELQDFHGKENCLFVEADVLSIEEFEAAFLKTKETFGYVNILINNAISGNDDKIVDVNLKGVINGCNIARIHMGKKTGGNGGAVVNVASTAGLMPMPELPVYAATKAGVISLARSLGHEIHYKKTGIKFTAICPSAVNTESFWTYMNSLPSNNDLAEFNVTVLEPCEVAEAIIQLLEDGKNGAVMTIVEGKGKEYISLPERENFV